jgi:DNA processing protein
MPKPLRGEWIAPTHATVLLLRALALPRVGVASIRRLAAQAGSASLEAFSPTEVAAAAGIAAPDGTDMDRAKSEVFELVERCEELDVEVISVADPDYPVRLKELNDHPPILFVKGDRRVLSAWPCIAVVGTRQASALGVQWAQKIARALAENGFTTVSGLAIGIDAAAHRGALGAHGRTVAVLAHGLHTIAPSSHKALAAEIVESGGALVSEHPPGVPPRPAEFVRRNRIQSGLSFASIVVESGREGGAIHQARFTREQGRILYAAMPDMEAIEKYDYNADGSRFLIAELKATPIGRQEELVEELGKIRQLALDRAGCVRTESQMTLLDDH